ncbi:MAG TPA: hypothetical protein VGI82_09870, partial [Chitinophagaceae bacterium]
MAKKPKRYRPNQKITKPEEAASVHKGAKKIQTSPHISFWSFKKISASMPFTQDEWAHILSLSLRTIQRYSKDEIPFEGIYADRLLHVQQMIEIGLDTFDSPDSFYQWLRREKNILGHILNFQSLYTTQGIQELIQQIERI